MISESFGSQDPSLPRRDVRSLARGLVSPAAQLVKVNTAARSHLGGLPGVSASFRWPHRDGNPLSLVAKIDLAELAAVLRHEWLPANGTLLFFYDVKNQPWGFDPTHRASWAVVHVPKSRSTDQIPLHPPAAVTTLPCRHVMFRRVETYPSWERRAVASLRLTDDELQEFATLGDAQFQGLPRHQVGGFPAPVQSDDMESECRKVSKMLPGGKHTGCTHFRARALNRREDDWKLLLQLDSDDELKMMWGDCGRIYFWIREQDARTGDFSDAWLVLQCC